VDNRCVTGNTKENHSFSFWSEVMRKRSMRNH